jgi:hypothetical protein
MTQGNAMRYLRIMGRLYSDNRLVLRPGYLDSRPRRRVNGDSELVAELFDDASRLLLSYPLTLRSFCNDSIRTPELAVRGWIPFHPNTRTVRFSCKGLIIHEVAVSRESPELELMWRPPAEVRGIETVTWKASHPEGRQLEYFCRYSCDNGSTWQRIGWRTQIESIEIDGDELPGGENCRLAIVATDGVNTTIAESESFSVAVKHCQAMILAPLNGQRLPAGIPILLHGQGYYLEERRPELEALTWTSSLDGDLGQGALLELSALSPGEHCITLVVGKEPRQGSATVTIWYEGTQQCSDSV